MPPAGAAPLIVTVPVDGLGPTTVVGFRLKPVRAAGLMVRVAASEVVPSFAVTVEVICAVTTTVLAVKAPVV